MNSIELFLAHAIQLEREAARRYEELTASMATDGHAELKEFFTRMARFSRLHLADAMARGGFREIPVLTREEFSWPDGVAPEVADWSGADAFMDARSALLLALDSEQRGHAYYAAIASTSQDPEVVRMAREFADEEAGHLAELEKLLAACSA